MTFVSLFRQINVYINRLVVRVGITATATFTLKLNLYIRINVHVFYSMFNCTIFIVLFWSGHFNCPLFKKKYNVSSWAPISGKMTFIWELICVMCSLAYCECVKFSLNIYKTGEQHTCKGVIPPLMGCFCENLPGCVIGRLQVVFERQLDLNSSSRWHGCCFLVRICTGERVSKLKGSMKRWNIS